MTVLSPSPQVVLDPAREEPEVEESANLPGWYVEKYDEWGERLAVAEWEDERYRAKHGWKGRDLVHSNTAPVRMLDYRVKYGNGEGVAGLDNGGIGTTLVGLALFTEWAESHKGFCHGGSMCSIMDDIVGWCAFLVTGNCVPWSGFTVQINTSLRRPIMVNTHLLVVAKIVKIERRKVSVEAELVDPVGGQDWTHATAEGLVVLNRGVLPEEQSS